ncbi:MAG: hypothetical protein M0Q38_02700 [Bacteroidales bacterium]|jgi:hypothetical protein|nr:hypothetical protein [Bacteroidales bacterium]
MNCRDAIEILDRMIFEEVPANVSFMQHLNTCSSCYRAYTDALKAREVMNLVRNSEPMLRDPGELTGNIMAAISKGPVKTFVVPLLLTRLLVAASVVLFILFGYEQYGIVKKISSLERQCVEIKPGSRYSDLLQQASTMNINEAGISFSELERRLYTEKGRTPLSALFMKKQLDQRNKK